ncbi:MAG: flagellar basal-body rod protein FlgG [Rhodospirillaceae bacterium]|jgi:flagellar basal-body rod protein FlgG|nr:flagellar basal-body rod protein FlgG [Rhodospirillaceae bacterium]MBT3911031.1 flagellar basal-body rod protein FlgG [Rhodospirillaceae bacterium]MBT5299889.1 flagellar basal-body rod protein FlgG [Rhodospirillaceae bacterium]MBT5513050.1 flagellar basal-body rod protein FlgG [Rhodospirillaceae bacterium]MBT6084234.1 flagellar basal-body rod protein FlgG [Rhodospirillaceae bacterium]
MKALSIAASGMMAQQRRTEVVANNLANMNTSGYQKRRTEFNDLIYKFNPRANSVSSKSGDLVPGGVHSGLGVKMAAVYRVNEAGTAKQTGNKFDMAIQGEGFFQVQLPNGEIGYTRDGSFQVNENAQLVSHDGFIIQPGIIIPPNTTDVTISVGGTVQAKIAGTDTPVNAGTVQLALFANPGGLDAVGNNLFLATDRSGAANQVNPGAGGSGAVMQGFVESSNVNAIEEISALIKAERAYSMNAKVLTTADQMMATRR